MTDRRGWLGVVVLCACGHAGQRSDVPANAPASAASGLCVPGQSIGCAGVAGCSGYQVCAPDGRSFGACDCTTLPDPGGTRATSCPGGGCGLSFASGPDWSSSSGTASASGPPAFTVSILLGPAKNVCLNAAVPANCPSGAVLYGHGGSATRYWAGGQGIPSAHWIWRADVAPTAPAPFQTAIFEKTFILGDRPSGTIQISVDDFAQVFVNRVAVGSTGSVFYMGIAGRAQNVLTTMDLTPPLRAGSNTITVVAQNGPFACDSSSCPYAQDPAGVVFAGSFRW
ncbi:MAG: hypothetical protein ACLP1X_16285 [Polyangiaceae bacterium]